MTEKNKDTNDGVIETTNYDPDPVCPGTFKLFGVEFAPFLLPLERRMQTFAVLYWMSTFLFFGPTFVLFSLYLFLYTRLWFLSVLYYTWLVYDLDTCNRGGRTGWWMRFTRGWRLWKHYRNFFPGSS